MSGEAGEKEIQQIRRVFHRRLQRSGRASLILALPKGWIVESGLKAHDTVALRWEENGSLHLYPIRKEEPESMCILDADKLRAPSSLIRALVAGYIEGHDVMLIRAKRGITKNQIEEVRRIVYKLIGLSIVEETETGILLRCYVDPTRNGIPNLLSRMYAVTRVMLNKFVETLATLDPNIGEEIFKLDEEVDRVYYLILRQLFTAAKNPALAPVLGIERLLDITGNRVVAHISEDVGDRCEKSMGDILRLLRGPKQFDTNDMMKLVQLEQELVSLYDKVFKAFLSVDYQDANTLIETSNALQRKLMDFCVSLPKQASATSATTLVKIATEAASITKHCRSIGEVTINRAVGMCKDMCERETLPKVQLQRNTRRPSMNIPEHV